MISITVFQNEFEFVKNCNKTLLQTQHIIAHLTPENDVQIIKSRYGKPNVVIKKDKFPSYIKEQIYL